MLHWRFWALICTLLSVTGCGTGVKVHNNLGPEVVTDLTDIVLDTKNIQCSSLGGKRVFTSFDSVQEDPEYREDINLFSGKLIKSKYEGSIEEHFKTAVDRILTDQCGAAIAAEAEDSDLVLRGHINRYYTQVLDYEKNGDESFFGPVDKEMTFDMKLSTILKVSSELNGEEYYYDHLVSMNKQVQYLKDQKAYFVIGFVADEAWTERYTIDYDDSYTLASGVTVNAIDTAMVVIMVPTIEINGHIDLYDPATLEVRTRIDLMTDDYDTVWTGRIQDDIKKEYIQLYGVPSGHLVILMYDYIKRTLERLANESV